MRVIHVQSDPPSRTIGPPFKGKISYNRTPLKPIDSYPIDSLPVAGRRILWITENYRSSGIGLAADKFFLSRPTAAAYQRAHSGKPLRHARPTGCAWLDRLRRLTGLPAVARADLLRVSAPEECRSTCLPKEWMLARCLGRGQWPKQPINILCLAAHQFPE